MDEFKEVYFKLARVKTIDRDAKLQERIELRKSMQCKSFQWFDAEVPCKVTSGDAVHFHQSPILVLQVPGHRIPITFCPAGRVRELLRSSVSGGVLPRTFRQFLVTPHRAVHFLCFCC